MAVAKSVKQWFGATISLFEKMTHRKLPPFCCRKRDETIAEYNQAIKGRYKIPRNQVRISLDNSHDGSMSFCFAIAVAC